MMLKSTLNAELARVNGERARLARARFAALARSDFVSARRTTQRDRRLRSRQVELLYGKPTWFHDDDE